MKQTLPLSHARARQWLAFFLLSVALSLNDQPLIAQGSLLAETKQPSVEAASSSSLLAASYAVTADPGALQQPTYPSGQQPAPPPEPNTFIGRWQARATATQNQQPHWVTPLVTVTPRLEQEFRTDFVHYYNNSRYEIWNYDNGKGLELIPEKHTELIVNLPPFFDRHNGESDGFGDVSFLLKERLFARNEENGNAIVTAFLGASIPTGKNGNGSCCAVITPTLAVGKGFGNLALTSTAGGSLPVTNSVGLGHSIAWNSVAQYRVASTGFARLLWPEIESNTVFNKGGPNDGKNQELITPGVIFGRIALRHDAQGKPTRLGFTLGAGEQIPVTHYHAANHYTVLTFRVPF